MTGTAKQTVKNGTGTVDCRSDRLYDWKLQNRLSKTVLELLTAGRTDCMTRTAKQTVLLETAEQTVENGPKTATDC